MTIAFSLPFDTTAPDLWAGLIAAVLVVLGFHWLARRRDARLARDIQGLVGTLQESGKVAWGHMETTNALTRSSERGLRGSLEEVAARTASLEHGQQQAGEALAQLEGRLAESSGRLAPLAAALADLRQKSEGAERARVTDLQALAARALSAERRAQEAQQEVAGALERAQRLETLVADLGPRAREAERRAQDAERRAQALEARAEALEGRSHDFEASIKLLLASASEKDSTFKAELAHLSERLERAASEAAQTAATEAERAARHHAHAAVSAVARAVPLASALPSEHAAAPGRPAAAVAAHAPSSHTAAPQAAPHAAPHAHGHGPAPAATGSDSGGLLALALLLLLAAAGLALGAFSH